MECSRNVLFIYIFIWDDVKYKIDYYIERRVFIIEYHI